MDRTVRQHINQLEQRLAILNSRIMEERDHAKRNDLQSELRAVESAITLYRSALEVENRIPNADNGLASPRA